MHTENVFEINCIRFSEVLFLFCCQYHNDYHEQLVALCRKLMFILSTSCYISNHVQGDILIMCSLFVHLIVLVCLDNSETMWWNSAKLHTCVECQAKLCILSAFYRLIDVHQSYCPLCIQFYNGFVEENPSIQSNFTVCAQSLAFSGSQIFSGVIALYEFQFFISALYH